MKEYATTYKQNSTRKKSLKGWKYWMTPVISRRFWVQKSDSNYRIKRIFILFIFKNRENIIIKWHRW